MTVSMFLTSTGYELCRGNTHCRWRNKLLPAIAFWLLYNAKISCVVEKKACVSGNKLDENSGGD